MQCNKNIMNTKVIRGNQFIQDKMFPSEFQMNSLEFNYEQMPQMGGMQPPLPPTVQCNCQYNDIDSNNCNIPYEEVGDDMEYSSCAKIESCSGDTKCCNLIQPQPITPANSMPYLIQAYKVSDAIKFDRVATAETAVLADGGTETINTGITVTGENIPVGTFKLNITEVCFGESTVTLTPGATTVGGNNLTATTIFSSNYNRLNRSGLDAILAQSCCNNNMGTSLSYSQNATTATITAADDADPANSIKIILKGNVGCSNVQIATTIDATDAGITLTYDNLKASLCKAYNMNTNILDQYYQSKLSLSCVEATITKSTDEQDPYEVNILQPVYLQLLLRTTASLLGYGLISVLGSSQAIDVRDIPVVTANFNFEECF